MPLAAFQPEREEVVVNRTTTFSVRALGVNDLTALFRSYLQDMELVGQIVSGQVYGRAMTAAVGLNIAMDLIRQAPAFVAAVIAIAADEPAEVEKAAALPFHAQVAALAAVGRLTFRDVDGLGNSLATLYQAAGAVTQMTPAEASP